MFKIIVTGGSGFIGTNLMDELLENGYEVLNLDCKRPLKKSHESLWKHVDILDHQLLEELIVDFAPAVIVHLAAVTDLNGSNADYYKANTQGTQHVIDIAEKVTSLKKVIFTSSMYVCRPGYIPANDHDYLPHTVYGQSKVDGELLVKQLKNTKYSWVIIRPTSIWGPWFNVPYIDFFNIVYRKRYFDFGRACTKTYGFIGNTTFQIRKIIEAEQVHEKIYYLGDLPAIPISEWADEISKQMGNGAIKKVPFFVLKCAAYTGDILGLLRVKFPMTSFRLSNMTTDNVLPLDNTYQICGPTPVERLEGVKKTLKWMSDFKGYDFKRK